VEQNGVAHTLYSLYCLNAAHEVEERRFIGLRVEEHTLTSEDWHGESNDDSV